MNRGKMDSTHSYRQDDTDRQETDVHIKEIGTQEGRNDGNGRQILHTNKAKKV